MSFLSRLTQRLGEAKREAPQTAEHPSPLIRFRASPDAGPSVKYLVMEAGPGGSSKRYPLSTQLEIGRDAEERAPTAGLLPGILTRVISQLPFPKSMRWKDLDIRFARPIHWIVALYRCRRDVAADGLGSHSQRPDIRSIHDGYTRPGIQDR